MVWLYSHPTGWYFLFLLLPVLRTICKCAYWAISLVGTLADSRWTNWCQRSGCVPITDVFDEVPANWVDLDLLGPG